MEAPGTHPKLSVKNQTTIQANKITKKHTQEQHKLNKKNPKLQRENCFLPIVHYFIVPIIANIKSENKL
jgi:hypothetical protein